MNKRELREAAKAKKLYRALFDEDWPEDWSIAFQTAGVCVPRTREIFILAPTMLDSLDTVIHEFIHMRNPTWVHGAKFTAEVVRLTKKVLKYE